MQLKRILVSLLVAMMILSTAVVAVSAEDTVTSATATLDIAVEASTADVEAGDVVEVNVVIKNNPGVRCVLFTLAWDADHVTPVTGADGKVVVATSDIYSFDDSVLDYNGVMINAEDIKFVSDIGNKENITATGTIATLSFKVNDDYKCSDGAIVIAVEGATALDANNEGYVANVTNLELVAHSYVDVAEVPATCTEPGTTAGKKCSVCETTVGVTEIPVAGHSYVDVAEVPATCTTAGKAAGQECSVCGETTGLGEIPALGHKEEPYKETGKKCSVCGEITVEPTVEKNNTVLIVIIIVAVVVVAAAAVIVYFFVIKKKKK